MKAIETRYNGHRFRSRLEARWAVFFDAAKIVWQYEPEGYILADGRPYLPDFYLPELKVFIEIKPAEEHFAEAEALRLCRAFEHPHAPLVVFYGLPGQAFGVCEVTELNRSGGGFCGYDVYWCTYLGTSNVGLAIVHPPRDNEWVVFCGHDEYEVPHPVLNRDDADLYDLSLNRFFDAASGARFEHGESGAG